jgi:hypothetical protein
MMYFHRRDDLETSQRMSTDDDDDDDDDKSILLSQSMKSVLMRPTTRKHSMCTNPNQRTKRINNVGDHHQLAHKENAVIISDVSNGVECCVKINGKAEHKSVIARLGPASSSYMYVSIPQDYAEGLMCINLYWPSKMEQKPQTLLVVLTPLIELSEEIQQAMTEVNDLSQEFCHTLKRYLGTVIAEDDDVNVPNFQKLRQDITLWSLRNGFCEISRKLLKQQLRLFENPLFLQKVDGDAVYKTYVYTAALSDSVDIVRLVIAMGGECSLFGCVSTIGNVKETRDTALHIAAMNGNTEMVLDFLSIVSSIDHWYTLKNVSGFSPRDCAILAQSSKVSSTVAKVLDDPLVIAANAICLAFRDLKNAIQRQQQQQQQQNGGETNNLSTLDVLELLEDRIQEVYSRTLDIIFESAFEMDNSLTSNAEEEHQKKKTIRLLDISKKFILHQECFRGLFGLAIERDCAVFETFTGADSTDRTFDISLSSGADAFLSQKLVKNERDHLSYASRFACNVRIILNKLCRFKYKAILAFDDPLIEKAFLLENSFVRRRTDCIGFILIVCVIFGRMVRTFGSFAAVVRAVFNVFEATTLSKFVSRIVGALTFPAAIMLLIFCPKSYVRQRESITVTVRLLSPLMWSNRAEKETMYISVVRVMLMRCSSCVYGCRIERHVICVFVNYFCPVARMLEIFDGRNNPTKTPYYSSIVETIDKVGCNKVLSIASIFLNVMISFLVEVRSRRLFSMKHKVTWLKKEWHEDGGSINDQANDAGERLFNLIQEEVERFERIDDDNNTSIWLICKRISEIRKSLQAKAYFGFSNPRKEEIYVLENSIFRMKSDLIGANMVLVATMINFSKHYVRSGYTFDWFVNSLYTSCEINNETMFSRLEQTSTSHIVGEDLMAISKMIAFSAIFFYPLFMFAFPRFYCRHRESIVMGIKLFCGISATFRDSQMPTIVFLIFFRSASFIMSVRFEREVLFIIANTFVLPRLLESWIGTTVYTTIEQRSVACKGNHAMLYTGIFTNVWDDRGIFLRIFLFLLVFVQILLVYGFEITRRRAFALKRKSRVVRSRAFAAKKVD